MPPKRFFLLALCLSLCLASLAFAQSDNSIVLNDESAEPFISTVLAGGESPLSEFSASADCTGLASMDNAVQLSWNGRSGSLNLALVSSQAVGLLVLQVEDFADDAEAIETYCISPNNPVAELQIPNATEASHYLILPTTASESTNAYLLIGRNALHTDAFSNYLGLSSMEAAPTTASNSLQLDPEREGSYGESSIGTGFSPNPLIIPMSGGGFLALNEIYSQCQGFVDVAPDYSLTISDTIPSLNIAFFATLDEADATMALRTPSGVVLCSDDTGESLDPSIDIINASGEYDIWIGNFNEIETIEGALFITENANQAQAEPSPNAESGSSVTSPDGMLPCSASADCSEGRRELNPNRAPRVGNRFIASDFLTDPFTVEFEAGGTLNASNSLGVECSGFVNVAPDFRLDITDPMTFLRIFFVTEEIGYSPTLIIRTAEGEWLCNDDSFGGLNPTIDLLDAGAGQYDIWVGSDSHLNVLPGTLYITENGAYTPSSHP